MRLALHLSEIWRRLDQRGRLIMIAAAILLVIGLVALARSRSAAAYAPLYTGLSAEDAGQMVEKLKAQKVPYVLTDGGSVISVPEDQVYEMRIALAKQGLPAAGQVGFEIFDRSGLPGTQFSNRVNYQRALQGELSRTIGAMSDVSAARVHLVLPEESLFADKTPARASVVVTPRFGARISPETSAAIAHIVASAVQEIAPEQVAIVDNAGRVLHGPDADGRGGLKAGQFDVQRQYEDRLCMNLQTMLDSILGPNRSIVRVQAQMDFDSEEVKDETVRPVAGGKGLVTSEKVREEQYRGDGSAPGGTAGLTANLGLGGEATSSRNGFYLNRDETREYQFSRHSSSLVKAPGKVKSLTIAAIIDESLDDSAADQVKQILSAAAGVEAERGDVITVQKMKMDAAEAAKTQGEQAAAADRAEQRQRLLRTALRSGLSLAAAAMILASIVMATRQLRQPLLSLPGSSSASAAPAAPVSAPVPAATSALSAAAPHHQPAPPQPAAPPAEEISGDMRDQLRAVARDDAATVTERIMTLLQEGSA